MKGKVSLYYNQITIGLQLGYNKLHHRLHRGSTVQAVPSKNKRGGGGGGGGGDDKGERQNEDEEE